MRSPPKAHEYGSRQQQPVTSRSRPPRSTAPAPPGANAPKPRLAAIPVVVASTSHQTRNQTLLGDRATQSQYATQTKSRSAQLDRPNACAPDNAGDARPQATTTEPQPTNRHPPQTVMAPPTPPIVDHTYRKTSPPTQTPLHSETGSKKVFQNDLHARYPLGWSGGFILAPNLYLSLRKRGVLGRSFKSWVMHPAS